MLTINITRLDEFLAFKRWNDTDLAKAMGYHKARISQVRNGKTPPSAAFIERLAKVTTLDAASVLWPLPPRWVLLGTNIFTVGCALVVHPQPQGIT